MDYFFQKDTGLQVDIESGGFVHGENPVSSTSIKHQAKILLLYGTFVDPPENRVSFFTNSADGNVPSVVTTVSAKLEANQGRDVEEKTMVKQKSKAPSAKKPPRPPKTPSLDAADQKLIREITELARLKRARIERMKALRKTKASKPSSSNSNALGFLFTIILGLLLILQGIPSRGRPANLQVSHAQGGPVDVSNVASAQLLGYPPVAARDLNGPVSSSPNSLEQVAAGLDPRQKLSYAG